MTQEAYNQLMEVCTPHDVFSSMWGAYSSKELGATFLPKIAVKESSLLSIYDGASLFSLQLKDNYGYLDFIGKPLHLNFYSYPIGAQIQLKKSQARLSDQELNIYFELSSDDNVDVYCELGRESKSQLKSLGMNIPAPSESISSNIQELKGYFLQETSHKTGISFLISFFNLSKSQKKSLSPKDLDKLLKKYDVDFEAGEIRDKENPESWGHGDIEYRALRDTNIFKDYRVEQIYYGNWLRDHSSLLSAGNVGFSVEDIEKFRLSSTFSNNAYVKTLLPKMGLKLSQSSWRKVIEVLAIKEFCYKRHYVNSENYTYYHGKFVNRFGDLTDNILGLYRPEEHIDNPKGLKNESIFAAQELDDPLSSSYESSYKKYKVRKPYKGPTNNLIAVNLNQMKNFIRDDVDGYMSSFSYVKQELRLAASYKWSARGMRHLGNAFHVIEDFFAHTNFVEIALIKNGYINVYPWVELNSNIQALDDPHLKAFNIPLVTGTFGDDDILSSIGPKLEKEFFPLEMEPYTKMKSTDKSFFDRLVEIVLDDFIEKEKNVIASKKSKVPGTNYTYPELKLAYATYVSMRTKWLRLLETPIIGDALEPVDQLLHTITQTFIMYRNILVRILTKQTLKEVTLKQINKTGFGTNPSHTQIAKDHADHFLNPLAGKLAYICVKQIGKEMKAVFNNSSGASVEKVISRLDFELFQHPNNLNWIDSVVVDWAKKHKSAIRQAESKTIIEHYKDRLIQGDSLTFEEINELIKGLLNNPYNE